MNSQMTRRQARLKADLRVLIADTEDLMRMTAEQAGEGVDEARDRIHARLSAVRGRLAGLQDAAADKAHALGDAAGGIVRDEPWRAIAAATAVGMLIGLLVSRR